MIDYSAIFARRERVIQLGNIDLPTGAIAACDPFFPTSVGVYDIAVPPGRYAVSVSWSDTAAYGRRIGLARLQFAEPSDGPSRWRRAEADGGACYEVSSGLGCFMDGSVRDAFARLLRDHHASGADSNYYSDVLAPKFRKAALQHFGRATGAGSLIHEAMPGLAIAIFSSGLGDGCYESYWELGKDDQPLSLTTDFGVV